MCKLMLTNNRLSTGVLFFFFDPCGPTPWEESWNEASGFNFLQGKHQATTTESGVHLRPPQTPTQPFEPFPSPKYMKGNISDSCHEANSKAGGASSM